MKKLVVLGTGGAWAAFSFWLIHSVNDIGYKAALGVLFLCIMAGVGLIGFLEVKKC